MIAPAGPNLPAIADRSAITDARQRETESALKSTRGHSFGNAGFKPRDRRRLARVIRDGVSRQELLAVLLCRHERQAEDRAAALIGVTLPALRELLASYRRREVAIKHRRRLARQAAPEPTPPAEPEPTAPAATPSTRPAIRAVIVNCAGCGAGYLMGIRVTRKCGDCGTPLRLTAADRRTIKANIAARAAQVS